MAGPEEILKPDSQDLPAPHFPDQDSGTVWNVLFPGEVSGEEGKLTA